MPKKRLNIELNASDNEILESLKSSFGVTAVAVVRQGLRLLKLYEDNERKLYVGKGKKQITILD